MLDSFHDCTYLAELCLTPHCSLKPDAERQPRRALTGKGHLAKSAPLQPVQPGKKRIGFLIFYIEPEYIGQEHILRHIEVHHLKL